MTSIKVINGPNDVRRLRVADWDDAQGQIKSRFDAQDFTAKYVDGDGDHVTISSEDEFQEALVEAKGTLRILLSDVRERSTDTSDVRSAVPDDDVSGVLVESLDDLPVEPTVVEPEEVQPVVTESHTEESEAEDSDEHQATVEALDTEPENDVKETQVGDERSDEKAETTPDTVEDTNAEESADSNESQVDEEEETRSEQKESEEAEESSGSADGEAQSSERRSPRLFDFIECVLGKGIEELVDNLSKMDLQENDDNDDETTHNESTERATDTKERLHPGVYCDLCEGSIVGSRYTCTVCSDYDMCESCYKQKGHADTHALVIRRVPDAEGVEGLNVWQRSCRARHVHDPVDVFNAHMMNWGRPQSQFMHNGCVRVVRPEHRFGTGCPRVQRRVCVQRRATPLTTQTQIRQPVTLFKFLDSVLTPQAPRVRKVNGKCDANSSTEKNTSCKGKQAAVTARKCHNQKPSNVTVRVVGRVTPEKKAAEAKTTETAKAEKDENVNTDSTKPTAASSVELRASGHQENEVTQKEEHKSSEKQTTSKAESVSKASTQQASMSSETSGEKSSEVPAEKISGKQPQKLAEKQTSKLPGKHAAETPDLTHANDNDQGEFVVVESVPDIEEPTSSTSSSGSATVSGTSTPKEHLDIMQRLHEMGFQDRSLNAAYIRIYGPDLNEIAKRLSERK